MFITHAQVAQTPVSAPACPALTDLELDTILRLTDVVREQALVYALDESDDVAAHLQDSFEDIKYLFLSAHEPDDRTAVVFATVHNLLFAA